MDTQTKKYEPLVSIVLTTFNGAGLIKEQIDSLLVQTYKNLRIIIMFIASVDKTKKI